MPKAHRVPPFPNQNSEERVREILESWSANDSVKITPCEKCGYQMLGKRHRDCE